LTKTFPLTFLASVTEAGKELRGKFPVWGKSELSSRTSDDKTCLPMNTASCSSSQLTVRKIVNRFSSFAQLRYDAVVGTYVHILTQRIFLVGVFLEMHATLKLFRLLSCSSLNDEAKRQLNLSFSVSLWKVYTWYFFWDKVF
jgi:hypothetical protein